MHPLFLQTLNYPFDTTEEQRLLAIQDIETCNPGGLGPNVGMFYDHHALVK